MNEATPATALQLAKKTRLLSDVLAAYMVSKTGRPISAPRTTKAYLRAIQQFSAHLKRPANIDDLTDDAVSRFIENKIADGMATATANYRGRMLSTLWSWSFSQGLTGMLPMFAASKALPIPAYKLRQTHGKRYGCVQLNGVRHHLGRHGSPESLEKYHRLIAEWLESGRSKSFGLPNKYWTVERLADDYVRHCEEYYGIGPNSEVHRVRRVLTSLLALYGSVSAAEFGPRQFKAVRQRLIGEGLSRTNINASMKRIVRMFRWATSDRELPPTIPQALAMVPGLRRGKTTAHETDPIRPVDNATVDATLPHLTSVVADLVRFHRLTGCRPAEACCVRPCDVDRTGDVWVYRPAKHKTQHLGHDRVICIGPQAQDVLRPYLLRDAESFCFSPKESEAKRRADVHAARTTPISCGNRPGTNRKSRYKLVRHFGECYDPRSYHHAIRCACIKAGIEPWAPNRLRHSAATEIRKQFGLEAAQVVLGHSQANVTQIYAERDHELAAMVAKQVG